MTVADSSDNSLIKKVTEFVREYMSHYDSSHDFSHIQRVVGLAQHIAAASPASPPLDRQIVTLAALLHDVGDRKYLQPGEDAATAVSGALTRLGADPELAATVQAICSAVSWTTERANPARVAAVLAQHPELAAVQDADRLDAIGAVGIGRVFAFGAARTARGMDGSIEHFDDKLLHIAAHMKTERGKELARVRTERLAQFKEWFAEEAALAVDLV